MSFTLFLVKDKWDTKKLPPIKGLYSGPGLILVLGSDWTQTVLYFRFFFLSVYSQEMTMGIQLPASEAGSLLINIQEYFLSFDMI